jgi:hypothetical protein
MRGRTPGALYTGILRIGFKCTGILLCTSILLAVPAAVSAHADEGQAGVGGRQPGIAQSGAATSGFTYTELQPIGLEADRVYGIAVDGKDRIFVSADNSILVFAPSGQTLDRFGLEEPARCLSVGPSGLLYLGLGDHVEVYDETGQRRAIWTDLGGEALITSIVAAGDEVLVADAGNRMVFRFDSGGRLLDYIRGDGSDGPELVIPSSYFDLLVTPEGTLWVVNLGRHSLISYSVEGGYLGAWGRSGSEIEAFCGCCNPTHIADMPGGRIVTSEKGISRIKIYDALGTLETVVASPELFREGTAGLDLAVDSRERVIVLDPMKRQVRIFRKDEHL